jgi:hypothetical protein
MPVPHVPLTVFFPGVEESWTAFLERARQTEGEMLFVLSGRDSELVASAELRDMVLKQCQALEHRVTIATKHSALISDARGRGVRVIDKVRSLKRLLQGHPDLDLALRAFSPQIWRQQVKLRLQQFGMISLPRLRVLILVAVSVCLFFFVVLRLLPSAQVLVEPRQETVTQTINIFLVQSGAALELPERVKTMPLLPIRVELQNAMTFDQISKDFIGTSAHTTLTVSNTTDEEYSFRGGTRFMNQAGMIFRIQRPIRVPPKGSVPIEAVADANDLYDQIIGERGNVPAGLRWEIPGLAPEEQKSVYAENRVPADGGTTAYRTVLRQQDLDLAQKKLEQDLIANAKQLVEEERLMLSARHRDKDFQILYYPELTQAAFSGFVLPTQFIGEPVTSIPVEGEVIYTVFAYDTASVLDLLSEELLAHVREGRQLILDSLTPDRLITHVIDYDDALQWIKITVDLSGTERYVLDPLTPSGALFAKSVRERIVNLSKDEAIRIIRNMPEVERATIRLWPPWSRLLPLIPAQISIVMQ